MVKKQRPVSHKIEGIKRAPMEFSCSVFLAMTSSFMHDWSQVPLYEKYITVINVLGSVT